VKNNHPPRIVPHRFVKKNRPLTNPALQRMGYPAGNAPFGGSFGKRGGDQYLTPHTLTRNSTTPTTVSTTPGHSSSRRCRRARPAAAACAETRG
jgi:hypothetical protein